MMDINVDLLQCFMNFLIKTSGGTVKNKNISNKELVGELHKPIIRQFSKRKEHLGADLADMELISKFNRGFRFLLFVINIYSKYALVIPL